MELETQGNDDLDPIAAAMARADPEVQRRAMQRISEVVEATSAFLRDAMVALDFNGITGDYAEFGSYGGVTMRLAHQHLPINGLPRHLWAFDSFEGLPPQTDERDQHPAWVEHTMAMDVETFRTTLRRAGVPDEAYTTVAGYYDESLPKIGDGAPTDIALAYVDCDLYSSTVTVLEFLRPRMKHGMIVAFDDYHCWSPTAISGERAALLEFEKANPQWHFHRYRDYGWDGTAFVVEDRSLLP